MTRSRTLTTPPASAAWTVRPLPRPDARLTLVCFHAAASGAAMYRKWPARLPDSMDVVLVRMPGRESRLAEAPLVHFGDTVTALADSLADCLDRPYALFGHSMGAHLAFAVAASRIAVGLRAPEHIFVSGTRPPHLFRAPLAPDATSDELVAALAAMGGTDPTLLDNEEARRIILRSFTADLRLCARLPVPDCPLACPLSVFGGEDDEIDRRELAEWSRWSSRSTRVRMFPGRHFFVNNESEDDVLRDIADTLDKHVGGAGG